MLTQKQWKTKLVGGYQGGSLNLDCGLIDTQLAESYTQG